MIGIWLRTWLKSNTDLAAIAPGKVFPGYVPQRESGEPSKDPLPAVTFLRTATSELDSNDGLEGQATTIYEVRAWSRGYDQAVTMGLAMLSLAGKQYRQQSAAGRTFEIRRVRVLDQFDDPRKPIEGSDEVWQCRLLKFEITYVEINTE